MFNLSKRSRFGLYVMVELARTPDKQRSTDDLAEVLGVSANHLAKVLQTLGRVNWVSGTRGPTGGYQLTTDPKRIAMSDVIELFEGTQDFSRCSFLEEEDCQMQAACEIKHVVGEIEEQAYYTLKSVTIHMLAEPSRKRHSALVTIGGRNGA